MDNAKLFKYIDEMTPEMVKTLGELISFPSVRGEPAEGAPFGKAARECLDRALEICKSFGLVTENVDGYAGSASLGEDPVLGILAHLDVVAAGGGWTKDPFKAEGEGGRLFGRGAMDDKGPAVSVMYALKALKELKVPLKRGVRLIMGTDEECGSSDIAYYRKKRELPQWLFTPDASYPLINIEKGHIGARFGAECRSEKLLALHGGITLNAVPASAEAAVAGISREDVESAIEKVGGSVKFDLTEENGGIRIAAVGSSAHASTPETGDNALTALIKVLSLLPLDQPAKGLILGLDRAFPYCETDGEHAGVVMRDEVSGALTLVLSILDYDGKSLEGGIDIRFPICGSVGEVREKLGKTLSDIGFTPDIDGSEPHSVSADSPFVRELLAAYREVTGKEGEPIAIGGGTYVHGIPGGVAFGCEVEGVDNRIHGADEFIDVAALAENAKIFAEAIIRVCNE